MKRFLFLMLLAAGFAACSDEEETLGGKDIQDGLCVFISPCGIKADGDLRLICLYTVDGKFTAAGSTGYRYQTGHIDESA